MSAVSEWVYVTDLQDGDLAILADGGPLVEVKSQPVPFNDGSCSFMYEANETVFTRVCKAGSRVQRIRIAL